MGRLRDADRRVARRAWRTVRRPALPAWTWFVIDLAAGSLVVAAAGELVGLVVRDAGQLARLVGLGVVILTAATNFVRSTR